VELSALLGDAVEAMHAEELSHLIVVDPYVGRPVGRFLLVSPPVPRARRLR
jgi:hypothetical protein